MFLPFWTQYHVQNNLKCTKTLLKFEHSFSHHILVYYQDYWHKNVCWKYFPSSAIQKRHSQCDRVKSNIRYNLSFLRLKRQIVVTISLPMFQNWVHHVTIVHHHRTTSTIVWQCKNCPLPFCGNLTTDSFLLLHYHNCSLTLSDVTTSVHFHWLTLLVLSDVITIVH